MSSERRKTTDLTPVKFGLKAREKALLLIAGGASLVVVLIVAIIANFQSNPADASQTGEIVEELPTAVQAPTKAYAPTEDVPAGTPMSTVQLKEVFWPRGQIPEGAIKDPAELIKLYAKVDLQAGVPLQRGVLSDEVTKPSLPLSPGKRAVSIEVDDTSGVEGHTLPGTKVDVVLTASEGIKGLVSSIIVQNARVISYGGRTSIGYGTAEDRKLNKTRSVRTLTLEVDIQDALKIQTARQMGRLSLMMRAQDDVQVSTDTKISGDEVSAGKVNPTIKAATQGDCQRGKMKMAGKDYIINCDGTLIPAE